jgi:hypothetical protein
MATLRAVDSEKLDDIGTAPPPAQFLLRLMLQWIAGVMAAFALGTWLVWWAIHLQREFALEEVRGACRRVMPETIERCVDTVIIQRGGARR